jgi:predicted phosphatase
MLLSSWVELIRSLQKAGFFSVKVVAGHNTKKLMLDTLLFIMAEKSRRFKPQ